MDHCRLQAQVRIPWPVHTFRWRKDSWTIIIPGTKEKEINCKMQERLCDLGLLNTAQHYVGWFLYAIEGVKLNDW